MVDCEAAFLFVVFFLLCQGLLVNFVDSFQKPRGYFDWVSHFSFPFTHFILADSILVKIEAVDLILVEDFFALDMLNNLHFDHLLTDIPSLAVVIFRLIHDPVQDVLAPQTAFVDSKPTCFEVLNFQLAPHYLRPVLQSRLLISGHLVLFVRRRYSSGEGRGLVDWLFDLLFFEGSRLIYTGRINV